MEEFIFREFLPYEDGQLAHLETTGGWGIPLNVFAEEGTDFALRPGDAVEAELWGDCSGVTAFATEAECAASGSRLAPEALIPTGTFPPARSGTQSPAAAFSGRVLEVEVDEEAAEDEPNCCLTVAVPDVTLHILTRSETPIAAGNYVRGSAWLYAEVKK